MAPPESDTSAHLLYETPQGLGEGSALQYETVCPGLVLWMLQSLPYISCPVPERCQTGMHESGMEGIQHQALWALGGLQRNKWGTELHLRGYIALGVHGQTPPHPTVKH